MHAFDDMIADSRIADEPSEAEVARAEEIKKVEAKLEQEYVSKRNGVKLSKMRGKTRRLVSTIEYVADLIAKDIDKDIEQLTPFQRVNLWKDLQEYLRPKLQRKELVGEGGGPVKSQHTVVLKPHASPALKPSVEVRETEEHVTTAVTVQEPDGTVAQNVSTIRRVPDIDDDDVQDAEVIETES